MLACDFNCQDLDNGNGNFELWKARSPLYQRQILQVNIHFSAFFEIYQIHIPSHRCKFKICRFFPFSPKILRIFAILQTFAEFSLFFFEIFTEFCRNFGKLHQSNVQFPGELGIRRIGELGIRNRMPGIGNWQSSKFEISGQGTKEYSRSPAPAVFSTSTFMLSSDHDTSLFPRLVLGCIKAEFYDQGRIFQDFSKSTR